jgi:hypothetical protein
LVGCDLKLFGGGNSIKDLSAYSMNSTQPIVVEQKPLANTPMHDRLKQALIESLCIPETSGDGVVSGEGTITRKGDVLEIDFEWSASVPYMYPHDGGHGTAAFMALL